MKPMIYDVAHWAMSQLTHPAQRRVMQWAQKSYRGNSKKTLALDPLLESPFLNDVVRSIDFKCTPNGIKADVRMGDAKVTDSTMSVPTLPDTIASMLFGMDASAVLDHETTRGRKITHQPQNSGAYTVLRIDETSRRDLDPDRYEGTSLTLEDIHARLIRLTSAYAFDTLARHTVETMDAYQALLLFDGLEGRSEDTHIHADIGQCMMELKILKKGPVIRAYEGDIEHGITWGNGAFRIERTGRPTPTVAKGDSISVLTSHPAFEQLRVARVASRRGEIFVHPESDARKPTFGLPPIKESRQ